MGRICVWLIPQIKRGDKDSNSDHEGKTRPVKGTSEEWVDPWARDKRSEKEKTAKTKRAPQKVSRWF